jgi:hypothetical protein
VMALSPLGRIRGGESVGTMASNVVGGWQALACFAAEWNSHGANEPASSIN